MKHRNPLIFRILGPLAVAGFWVLFIVCLLTPDA